MKAETFRTVVALDKRDPMTAAQRKALAGGGEDEILTAAQVSELTGLAVETIRKRKRDLPPMGFTRLLRYRKSDVMRFLAG